LASCVGAKILKLCTCHDVSFHTDTTPSLVSIRDLCDGRRLADKLHSKPRKSQLTLPRLELQNTCRELAKNFGHFVRTNAHLETVQGSLQFPKQHQPQQTSSYKIRWRRCARRMAHRDIYIYIYIYTYMYILYNKLFCTTPHDIPS
jgi:hypothetical protein